MPLETAPVGSPGFGRNVATEIKAGKPEKQAVAIAYSKAGERSDASDEYRIYTVTFSVSWSRAQVRKYDAVTTSEGMAKYLAEQALKKDYNIGPRDTYKLESVKKGRVVSDYTAKTYGGRAASSGIFPDSEDRKDGTEIASHDPLNAKLDAAFKLADALFERADSVSRKDAKPDRKKAEEAVAFWQKKFDKAMENQDIGDMRQASSALSEWKRELAKL